MREMDPTTLKLLLINAGNKRMPWFYGRPWEDTEADRTPKRCVIALYPEIQ